MDWGDASDISYFYEPPILSIDEIKGQKEFIFPLPKSENDGVLLNHEWNQWKESDVAYYFSSELSWPNITQQSDFLNSEFSFLSKLNSYDQAHIILRLFFSRRSSILEPEFKSIAKEICRSDIVIGVHVAETSLRSNDYVLSHCFIPKMIHVCRLAEEAGRSANGVRSRCVFYLTSEKGNSALLNDFTAKLHSRVEELVSSNSDRTSFSMDYSVIIAPDPSGFSYYLSLVGFRLRESFMSTYLNWEVLNSADYLLTSPSSFALSSFWFSGSPSIIVKAVPKSGECQFYPTVPEGLYTVVAQNQ
jgi:hypothetical protein